MKRSVLSSLLVVASILFVVFLSTYLVWAMTGQHSTPQSASSELVRLGVIPMTPGVPLTTARVISFVGVTAFEGGQTVTGKPPTILLCQEMTSRDAERLYKLEDMPTDNRMVIYVQLHGPFIIPHLLRHNPKMPPVQNVDEVFDATNGEILSWGVIA